MKEKTNYNFVNVLKFVFSIFVIASHTKLIRNISNQNIISVISLLINCAVPFFFLCMGYSLAEKIDFNNCDKKQLIKIKAILISFIKQYLFWSLAYLPLAFVEYSQTGNSFIYSFFSYMKGLFLKGEHYNSWMLWYLLSFIYALSFIYICLKRNIKFSKISILCLLIGSLSIILKYSNYYKIESTIGFFNIFRDFIKLTLDNGRIFTAFIYIILGIQIKNSIIYKHYYLLFLLISIIVYFISNTIIKSLLIIIISSLLFVLTIEVKLSNRNIYTFLRDLSTSNYYLHMYVFTIYYYLIYGSPAYTIDCFIFTMIVTIILGVFYILFKNKRMLK